MRKGVIYTTILLLSIFLFPICTKAVTLGDYEAQVRKYEADINNKNSAIAQNNAKIEEIAGKILETQNKITQTENEIARLKKEIAEANKEIKKKEEESKRIVEYYQLENGENAYLEYAFGADSITDMIYRMSVVEQLTEYNDNLMKELEALIKKNQKRTEELNKKTKELAALKRELEFQKKKLETDNSKIEGSLVNVKEDLKVAKAQVAKYRAKGCKSSDRIGIDCARPPKVNHGGGASDIIGANGFRRPVPGANISWGYGGGHKGVDFTKYCGAPIYAVATGQVYYVGNTLDYYGAKMVMTVHNVTDRLVFSQYAHLGSYGVSTGQVVTPNTVIGYMGNTGYSTGCHLHLEMSEDYGWNYNMGYYSYINHIISPFKYIP